MMIKENLSFDVRYGCIKLECQSKNFFSNTNSASLAQAMA